MNKKIIKNSITFLAVAFLLVSTSSALAYVPGVWDPQPRVNTNEPAFTKVAITYDAPVAIQTTPVVVPNTQNQNVTPTQQPKQTVSSAPKQVVRPNTSATSYAPYSNNNSNNNELRPIVTSGNDLAALSLQGSGGFMPSSIWQWFLVILLILAIIIIARVISRKNEHHEIHTVTAH